MTDASRTRLFTSTGITHLADFLHQVEAAWLRILSGHSLNVGERLLHVGVRSRPQLGSEVTLHETRQIGTPAEAGPLGGAIEAREQLLVPDTRIFVISLR